jgi:exosortase E/protease (VPEID-CTERM system)
VSVRLYFRVTNAPQYETSVLPGIAVPRRLFPLGLSARLISLAFLFVLELIAISVWLDTRSLTGGGLVGAVGDYGPRVLRSLVVMVTVLLAFSYSKAKHELPSISDRLADAPIAWRFLAAHCGAMGIFALLSSQLFVTSFPFVGMPLTGIPFASGTPLALAWLAVGLSGIALGVSFLFPRKILRELTRIPGSAWIYALAAAILTPVILLESERLWKPLTALTFDFVNLFLAPFVSGVITNPVTRTIGTEKFNVEIAPACSGLEGVGLMLIFSVLWLCFFRGDYRFPRVLLLIPVGVCGIFMLNAVRIAALILIGDSGARAVALGGFHSQAGWIAFNGVAFGLVFMANRVPWLSSAGRPAALTSQVETPPDAYLAPFLTILAAGMISRATSGTFEWMYPLRFFAAAGVLLFFRRKYASIDWRFGWAAPVIGALVFALWIGLDRYVGPHVQSGVPPVLVASPAAARITWLVLRTLAAVITVPIAEELAFRGFLLRRLISADFESVSLQCWSFFAVVGSSVAFGLLHGDRWIAGTLAGFLYAGAQKWRGRIGDAVVAHGITNALIAVWVLWAGDWSLW